MRVFGNTIATGVHLAHKDLHGAITSLSLLERVLEPPLHTVRYHQSQWQPILLSLRALHYLLLPRVDSDSPGFRCFRGRDSDSRYGFCVFRPWELVWSDNFGELLELGGWRNWFSHKTNRKKSERVYKNIEGVCVRIEISFVLGAFELTFLSLLSGFHGGGVWVWGMSFWDLKFLNKTKKTFYAYCLAVSLSYLNCFVFTFFCCPLTFVVNLNFYPYIWNFRLLSLML